MKNLTFKGVIIFLIFLFLGITGTLFYKKKNTSPAPSEEFPRLSSVIRHKDFYIQHIRIAFDEYTSGGSRGIEDDAITAASQMSGEGGLECGLANFDKSIYKNKFLIYLDEPGEYGGYIAHIAFVNKPDTFFWVWIYDIGDENNPDYVLRAFCKENSPIDKPVGLDGKVY